MEQREQRAVDIGLGSWRSWAGSMRRNGLDWGGSGTAEGRRLRTKAMSSSPGGGRSSSVKRYSPEYSGEAHAAGGDRPAPDQLPGPLAVPPPQRGGVVREPQQLPRGPASQTLNRQAGVRTRSEVPAAPRVQPPLLQRGPRAAAGSGDPESGGAARPEGGGGGGPAAAAGEGAGGEAGAGGEGAAVDFRGGAEAVQVTAVANN